MVAIQSTKKLQFPPANTGYVRMEIDLIQNKPNSSVYELRIKDTCFERVLEKKLKETVVKEMELDAELEKPERALTDDDYEEVEGKVEKILGHNIRLKTYKYEQLEQLSSAITGVSFNNDNNLILNINKLFLEGLLLTTQAECMQGISGEGKGMYFSEVTDWIKL